MKEWVYKQKYYRDSMWNKAQRFIAFQVIPFIIISLIVGCFVLGLLTALIQ